MPDDVKGTPPEAIRAIVRATAARALARCDRLGVAREDFYVAMLAGQKLHPTVSVTDLVVLTFRRLGGAAN